MQIRHDGDRSLADTAAMAAITHRRPWVIRSTCPREPVGYDVEACAEVVAAAPEPVLLTAAEATHRLGLAASTVRQWAHRGRLRSWERNERGHPLYDEADLRRLGQLGPR